MNQNICEMCPRKCKVDRNTSAGFCGAKTLKIAKVMKHYWEEPIISGTKGSGAVFFSHCNLKCEYCQNYEISSGGFGKEITVCELAKIFEQIQQSGAENINLVSPTHYAKEIMQALDLFKPNIPVVWNTGGYENPELVKKLKDYVDVYLCDLKYSSNQTAQKYSKANDYFENCTASILQMRKNQPKDIIENGMMKKGVIIRHLVLPSYAKQSCDVLMWIKNNLGNKTYISLMSQYTPCYNAKNYDEINRQITPLEYKLVVNKLEKLGFENGFTQQLESATKEYIPPFKQGTFMQLEDK